MTLLEVCIGSSCHLKGSYNIIQTFRHLIEERNLHECVEFKATFCMRECMCRGVSVRVNGNEFHIMPEEAATFFDEHVPAEK